MADQQININVNINSENLKQLPQLKTAIDTLKDSVINLNKEILNYNKQSQEAVNWGTKIKTIVKDLGDTFDSAYGRCYHRTIKWER